MEPTKSQIGQDFIASERAEYNKLRNKKGQSLKGCGWHTEEWKEKMRKMMTGNKFALGIKHTDEWKKTMRERMSGDRNPAKKPGIGEKISKAKIGKKRPYMREEKCRFWRGDDVEYHGIHKWLKRQLGQPTTCERCGKTGLTGHKIHWHRKNHEYKRDLDGWMRLCASCHKIYQKNPWIS